jgi:methyl-accepting chemotaxis protein
MSKIELSEIHSHLLKNFVLNIMFHPVFLSLIMIIGVGAKPFFKVIPILLAIMIPIIGAVIFAYSILTKKLQGLIDKKIIDEKSAALAVNMPRLANIIIASVLTLNTILTAIACYHQKIIFTPVQIIFFIVLGSLLTFAIALYHYYRMKIILYPLTTVTKLRSLAIFEKLLAPILSFMITVLLIVGIGIYSINVNRTIKNYKAATTSQSEKIRAELDRSFMSVETEIYSYMNLVSPDKISQQEGLSLTKNLFAKRINKSINTLFIFKNDGTAYSNAGLINLSDREYIKDVVKKNALVWSDLITSKTTGKKAIVCTIPNLVNGSTSSGIGATVSVDTMTEIIDTSSTINDTAFAIINQSGKIVYHKESRLIDKTLGIELKDETGKDVTELLRGTDDDYQTYIINNRGLLLKKFKLESTGHFLMSISYLETLLKAVDRIIINVLVGLLFIIICVVVMIYRIGLSFSKPIRNTIRIFGKLSEGDLTVRSNDFLSDEFGDMIKNLKNFQDRIIEVINSALSSSNQLASSAEELAATSSNLAESAQSQAAAVEEATASLEEISASNESIADNSKVQSDHSKNTYKAMEELGNIVRSVNTDATGALNVANVTATEAKKGSDLMQNTITGMNSIEENSLKIAEMVSMISDISDQVNLLALNAAIEAARAGDHGRGFAVVADEIGKLAEQTAESAKSITGLVSNGVKSAKQGIHDIGETSKALANIINYITETKELVQKIANSTDLQARSSEQVLKATGQVMEMSDNISNSTSEQTITHMEISRTMDQINEQTQSQASGAEQIASSAEQISAQAENMKSVLEFFKTS